jgi:uncharacterized protein GlcG (DUF336 family)
MLSRTLVLGLSLAGVGLAGASAQTPPPATAVAPTARPPEAIVSAELISRADAQKLVQRSLESCEKRGFKAAAIVTDTEGHMRAALSSDGMNPIGIASAGRKTATVMNFKLSTHALRDKVAADPAFAAQYGKDERYYFSPGGLPLFRSGKFVAVLAVGGARTEDEACALDALKMVPWAKTSN